MAQNASFHEEPFDEGTLCKLEIYRMYLRNYIPKWKGVPSVNRIVILDYFCGPGSDSNREPGSPLIALDEVKQSHVESAARNEKHCPVDIRFFDSDASKIERLKQLLDGIESVPKVRVSAESLDFDKAFQSTLGEITSPECACLAFIDQFGVKEVDEDRFQKLVCSSRTDILFFLASSSVKRFITTPEFRKRIRLNPEAIEKVNRTDIHRFLCEKYYKPMIPEGIEYFVAPFSIQKGQNVYGLIFGSSSLRGMETFLEVAWKMDKVSGSANFNIDGELVFGDGEFAFTPLKPSAKMQKFSAALQNEIILRKGEATNKDVYRFSLENGFLPKHANKVLKRLQNAGNLKVAIVSGEAPRQARKGAFYIDWSNCGEISNKARVTVAFSLEEDLIGYQPD